MSWKNNTVIKEFILLGLSSDHTTQILLFVMFSLMYAITLIANSSIILVTVTDSNLHSPMYFFLTNLSLVDILYSSSVIFHLLKDLLVGNKSVSFGECFAQIYTCVLLGAAECLLLAILAYDRYIAICYPLHYTKIINRDACVKMLASTWVCGLLAINPIFCLTWNLPFCDNVINHFFCELPGILSLGCGNVANIQLGVFIVGIMVLITPITFILVTYIKILGVIFKISSSAGWNKTFSTCGSHIIVASMFYGSAVAAYMKPQTKATHDTDKLLAIFYNIVTPMMNPLIYTLRNKDVKSSLKRFYLRVTCGEREIGASTTSNCVKKKKLHF
ncbi:olfactory receptor 2B6-like [Gastrophryne carolinensis]